MSQGKSHKKPRIFWIYYFFIALPFFAYRFFIWEPKPYEDKSPDWFKNIEVQKSYLSKASPVLYSSDMTQEVGQIYIVVDEERDSMTVSMSGNEYSGYIVYLENRSYEYEEVSLENQVFKPKKTKDSVIWVSNNPIKNVVISPIDSKDVGAPQDQKMFLIQIMNKNDYERIIVQNNTSIRIEHALYFGIDGSNYTGIFIVPE
ncbi:hypothetical protein [Marispirochaeta sp.]|uniref:hypothetical protein n=1 Tax=Marispirochaeta sp. TaxID=2038653 RepID=UPI0029C79B99|nr:hypothetical protein [Marispirochaeta sp.]